ncbi:uncharacterized protein LOC110441773 [Mizuhopecten yessoensis]|uniref:Prokineticin domain-containing protein n=1 Tax=Mizuhopecten yessoensis TaxID=6573 RepID=A0A210PIP5_MIZYE|nr:uncharacterized protein LOC110441773 [Mizuhopecten yessoensis]OWF36355.1 hypothetical protein KP79_PYT11586 [Mizuhopecten yessoensis]
MASILACLLPVVLMCVSADAQPANIDPVFLEEMYACNPPCLPDECCIHVWTPDNTIGKRFPKLPFRMEIKRTLTTHCEPLKTEGSECLVQKNFEICPCGRNLVCSPNQGNLGLYFGTCKP